MLIRHRIFQVMAALIVLLGFAFGSTGAAHAATNSTCYYLSPVHSGHYLDVEGGSTADGARIIQWYRSWSANQKFKFWHDDSLPSDVWYIESVSSGKVLSVNSYAAGAPVLQWSNQSATSQQWIEIATAGGYKYRNVATGLYFDVSGYSYSAGAPLVQWSGTTGLNQVFARSTTSC